MLESYSVLTVKLTPTPSILRGATNTQEGVPTLKYTGSFLTFAFTCEPPRGIHLPCKITFFYGINQSLSP